MGWNNLVWLLDNLLLFSKELKQNIDDIFERNFEAFI